MSNVVNITSRLEKWGPDVGGSNVGATVSSHGRLRLRVGGETVTLDMMDAATILAAISRQYDKIV
jgi:hypothetical protein